MIRDEFSSQFCFRDEEDSELSDEEQKRNWPENRPKHTRKRVHQAEKKLFVEIQNSFLKPRGNRQACVFLIKCRKRRSNAMPRYCRTF